MIIVKPIGSVMFSRTLCVGIIWVIEVQKNKFAFSIIQLDVVECCPGQQLSTGWRHNNINTVPMDLGIFLLWLIKTHDILYAVIRFSFGCQT